VLWDICRTRVASKCHVYSFSGLRLKVAPAIPILRTDKKKSKFLPTTLLPRGSTGWLIGAKQFCGFDRVSQGFASVSLAHSTESAPDNGALADQLGICLRRAVTSGQRAASTLWRAQSVSFLPCFFPLLLLLVEEGVNYCRHF
jgi:hypothetical protein